MSPWPVLYHTSVLRVRYNIPKIASLGQQRTLVMFYAATTATAEGMILRIHDATISLALIDRQMIGTARRSHHRLARCPVRLLLFAIRRIGRRHGVLLDFLEAAEDVGLLLFGQALAERAIKNRSCVMHKIPYI